MKTDPKTVLLPVQIQMSLDPPAPAKPLWWICTIAPTEQYVIEQGLKGQAPPDPIEAGRLRLEVMDGSMGPVACQFIDTMKAAIRVILKRDYGIDHVDTWAKEARGGGT